MAGGIRKLEPARLAYKMRRLWWRFRRPQTRGARAIVADGVGRICLVRHTYTPGWYLPGGQIRHNEDPEAAVSRELREETGMHAEAIRLIGAYANDREGKRDMIFVYEIHASGEPEPSCPEIAECGWFPVHAPPPDASPATRRRLLEFTGAAEASPTW